MRLLLELKRCPSPLHSSVKIPPFESAIQAQEALQACGAFREWIGTPGHEDSITAGLDANWIAIVSSSLLEAPEAGHDSRYGIEIPYVSRCPRVK